MPFACGRGSPVTPLSLKLLHTQHSQKPSYEALSYAWGDKSNENLACLNNRPFPIRKTVSEALQQLRSPYEDLVLWIDAICIDQGNLVERFHQVGQMRAIYSGADRVRVWLGTATAKSDVAMDWLEDMSPQRDNPLGLRSRIGMLTQGLLIQDQTEKWKVLDELCMREYWKHVWIVQEVVLASRIVLHCGDAEVKWAGFENIINEYEMLFKQKETLKFSSRVQNS